MDQGSKAEAGQSQYKEGGLKVAQAVVGSRTKGNKLAVSRNSATAFKSQPARVEGFPCPGTVPGDGWRL